MYITIQTLWNKGHNKSEIARLTGHDWKTINKVIVALSAGKQAPEKKPHIKLLDSYQEQIINYLEQKLSALRIHEELLKLGVTIGYSTVKDYVASIKNKREIFVRVHTEPGEEAQVDFGYVGYTLDNTGKRRKTWVFNMRLSYSRLDFYKKVYDQKVETFILCHIQAFRYFGGIPKRIKIDNLKAAILEANFYEPVYQKLYKDFADYYGFESIPCRIYKPNDKGKVESGIKYVKGNFFLGRHFKSSDDVDAQLSKWLEKANNRLHGTTRKIPREEFEHNEKKHLLKIPLEDFNLSKVGIRKVYHDCHVFIEQNYYSVPYSYVGKEVEIEVGKDVVRIYYNQTLIATHIHLLGKGEFSTTASHYPKYKCMSATEFQEKYQVKMAQIGAHAEQLFFSILEYKKNTWVRPVQGILSLTKKYPLEVINRSCQRALAFDAYEYSIVKNICKSGSYNLPLEMN
ncbi:IS21 family transposase [Legionella sainthelensi]|uniref:IS21 family transposase n=1 Tax=Legionella sainthelensi TaxID=28087 RepID=UPI001359CA98|nr:IS21 family transposase [Legionella sainthelensi]